MAKRKDDEGTASDHAGDREQVTGPDAPAVAIEESQQDVKDTVPLVATFDEPVPLPDLPPPPAQAPDTVLVHNRSGQLLTIKSRGSILFPPGATEEVSRAEADLWVSKGWVVIKS